MDGKKLIISAVLVTLLLVSGITAFAQLDNGVIYACVNPNSGILRGVGAGEECPDDWELLSWNQTGPQGPAGPTMARSGVVFRDGSIGTGNNFSVTKLGTGNYRIEFDSGVFSGFPVPTVTIFDNATRNGVTPLISSITSGGTTSFNVAFFDTSGNPIDTQFSFNAMDSSISTTAAFTSSNLQKDSTQSTITAP